MHVNARTLGALTVVYLAWGGTYPAIRVMVETVPPLIGTGVRFLVAGVVMGGVLAALGRLRAERRSLIAAAIVGSVILGDIGVLAVAEQEVPAGLAALVIASVPLWVVCLQLLYRQRLTRRTALAGAGRPPGDVAARLPRQRGSARVAARARGGGCRGGGRAVLFAA